MKSKNIIITDSKVPGTISDEILTSLNSDNLKELTNEKEKIKSIYIDESTLLKHPEITSVILKLKPPSKIIIDTIENITQKLHKYKSYKDTDKIPLEFERIISDFLKDCMIKNNHSGYSYLVHSFFILFLDSSSLFNVKKNIYFPIETRFETPEESVERCIKYAIRQGFIKSKELKYDNIFNKFFTPPSNKTFLEESFKYLQKQLPDFRGIYFFNK